MYTFDNIPLKLYEKIQLTGDLSLLSDDKSTNDDLKAAWDQIINEAKKVTKSKGADIALSRLSELKMYESQKSFIITSVAYLREKYSEELAIGLKKFGFIITKENLQEDLNRVELGIGDIDILINDVKSKIETKTNQNEIRTDTIIAYQSKFFGGYIDSNKITLSQYLSNNDVMKEISKKDVK